MLLKCVYNAEHCYTLSRTLKTHINASKSYSPRTASAPGTKPPVTERLLAVHQRWLQGLGLRLLNYLEAEDFPNVSEFWTFNVEGLEIRSLQWSLIRRGGSTTKPVFYLQHAGRCDLRRGLLLPSVHWCLGLEVSTLNLIFNMIFTKFKAGVFQAGLSGPALY